MVNHDPGKEHAIVIKNSTNHEEMRDNLLTVFNRFQESGFKLNLEKCNFGTKKVNTWAMK